MSDEHQRFAVDPETIAALLDGRLEGDERARVLAAIDASPELLAVVSDAAAVRELARPASASPAAQAPSESPPPEFRRRRPRWVVPAIAAAAIVIIAVPLTRRVRNARAELSAPSVVALLERPSASAGELPPPAWGALRGSSDGASSDGRAVRIGALLADANLLNSAGDTTLRRVAIQIAMLLENSPGASIEAPAFREIAEAGPGATTGDRLRDEAAAVEALLEPGSVRAGVWLETARVAAARGDTAFFGAAPTGDVKKLLLTVARGSGGSADSLVAALGETPRDLATISTLSTRLLTALGR